MDERSAITRLKQGDIAGLEVLVRVYQEQAVEAAYLITRDAALAEDIVQSAFLRAYERIGQFDSTRPFGPWFLRSVVNSALTAVTTHRHLSLETGTAHAPGTESDSLGSTLPSPEPGAAELFEAAETREEILAALEQLSPGQRSAVVLRYYLDLSDSEVAQRLAIPPGTVRRRLYDARQRLRRLLPTRAL
jgi:RNA polymerase sigma-70 factor (ECF subfamily)